MNDGLRIPPEQTTQMRQQLIEGWMIPLAETLRRRHATEITIRSIAVCVAQYWDDEASDAVHCRWVISQLETPDWPQGLVDRGGTVFTLTKQQAQDRGLWRGEDPNLPAGLEQCRLGPVYNEMGPWDDNRSAISLAAAWCREGAHQDTDDEDNFLPFVILRHDSQGWAHELVPMIRPWLDGVRSQDLLEWPTADQVWERSQVVMPPHPRTGDVALAELHALGRALTDPQWWPTRLRAAADAAPPPITHSLAVIADAARYFELPDLADALNQVDIENKATQQRVAETYPTPEELRAAFDLTYWLKKYDFSPEGPDGTITQQPD
ncbi:MAG: hypothetical protein GY925_01745 [Actinomycetia bacterium]|nr:hypothetical protein [Actinomycetes bacterium]